MYADPIRSSAWLSRRQRQHLRKAQGLLAVDEGLVAVRRAVPVIGGLVGGVVAASGFSAISSCAGVHTKSESPIFCGVSWNAYLMAG